LIGGLITGGIEFASQYLRSLACPNVDWRRVGRAAAEGAVLGALGCGLQQALNFLRAAGSLKRLNRLDITFSEQRGVAHGARHLGELSPDAVHAAIRQEIVDQAGRASVTGEFWGRVKVSGQLIEYRAFTLPSGRINVGTYYPL
jgi:hypothetical protein